MKGGWKDVYLCTCIGGYVGSSKKIKINKKERKKERTCKFKKKIKRRKKRGNISRKTDWKE